MGNGEDRIQNCRDHNDFGFTMGLAGGAVTQPVSTGVQIDQNGNPSIFGNTSASNSFADELPGHSGTLGAIRLAADVQRRPLRGEFQGVMGPRTMQFAQRYEF